MKPFKIESDMLIFDASSLKRSGIIMTSESFLNQVEKYCQENKLEISAYGGNNDKNEFYVYLKEELTEEQAVELITE